MNNVKLILVLFVFFLGVVACAKNNEQASVDATECKSYASAYEVEFPDSSLRKSNIEACGSLFKATDLDQDSNQTIVAERLTIQLKDAHTGISYLTTFSGQ